MSKIEQALEKAVKMRETIQETVSETVSTPESAAVFNGFQVGDAIVNKALIDKHIVCITDPFSSVSEQFKKLKARILNQMPKQDFRNTIMVTSSDIGEGKSIVAINLAVALSNELDYTVLLVDADLRNPSIHRYFGIEPEYGLSDYLTNKVPLNDILIKTGIGKLVILPAGNIPDNSAELLSSERMKMLVHELKHRYKDRYIIFDSTPLLVTADPLVLGMHMDGVVFVIQEGRTSQQSALQSMSLMKGWNILGAVFNNVPEYLVKGHYQYYYRQNPDKKEGNNHEETV
jgi:receptor protein-tyrosine kinase/non-specific protein-tyrosine kinase